MVFKDALKSGWKTSEFWLTVAGIGLLGGGTALKFFAPVTGPFAIPAAVGSVIISYIAQRYFLKAG